MAIAASVKPGARRRRRAASDEVAGERLEAREAEDGAALLAQATRVAEPQPGRASRLVVARPCAARLVRAHLHVEAQLVVQLAVELRPPEQQADAPQEGLEARADHAVSSTRAMAPTSVPQRSSSLSSRRRPRAVSV